MKEIIFLFVSILKHDGRELPNSDYFTDNLLRLPLYYELTEEQVITICNEIKTIL